MALCLLQINQCAYSNCGQYFANQYELIAHVEFQHIPLLEEEMKRKALAASANGDERASTTAPPNVPLSIISRVFRTAYRPNPIKYEGIKVSFNHYKKRALRERMEQQKQQLQQLRAQINPDDDKKVGEIDFEECQPSDPEMRFRCGATECTKRYKNIYALKVHMKSAHQLILGDSYEHQNPGNHQHHQESSGHPQTQNHPQNQSPAYSNSSGALAPGSPAQTLPSPSKPHKCSYCSKRYKTPVGLTNHLMQAHQKSTPGPDAPSQEVVNQLISQARAQGQQERMAQQAQSAQPQNSSAQNPPQPPTRQLTLPVSVNMSNTSLQSQNSAGISHVSRSFTVTTTNQPLRLSQNYGPATLTTHGATTTGQMLLQQQRRLQQQQQAAAAAAAAANSQQQYQSPQQQQYTMSPVRMHQQHHQNPQPQQQHQIQTPPRPQIAAGPQQQQSTVSSQPPPQQPQQTTVPQNVQNAPQ